MTAYCEACQICPVDTIERCDNESAPYRLCSACHTRLHARALRPVEWYNLSKRHGWWQFLLHDDFYDESGSASQPEVAVESPELYLSPTLDDVSDAPETLLDFTITRWHFTEAIAKVWRNHSPDDVLRAITCRFSEAKSRGIKSAILDVAAILGTHGEQFVRCAWNDYPDAVDLPSLAKATASCLPFRDGFALVVEALSHCEDHEKGDLMLSLSYFHASDALDWIEANVSTSITESWGRLAAASKLDWPRVTKWLELGRPLSLVALDAMAEIIRPRSPLLRADLPRLHQPPDFGTLNDVLASHAKVDAAPRVVKKTQFILNEATALINTT
jgi:hypothetical protein